MDDLELGQATIVYDDPDGGVAERTVDNESILYVRDHWHVRTGTDDDGNDLMIQIPKERVHRVDRTVETFEEQAGTVRRRVESLASDLRERIPVTGGEDERRDAERTEPTTISVDDGDSAAEAPESAEPHDE